MPPERPTTAKRLPKTAPDAPRTPPGGDFGDLGGAIIALPSSRGIYIHVPLMIVAALIALRDKSVSLVWLTLLVVIAEFLIVVGRFIYGYEQTFMGDLVRFWYAALFLFASNTTRMGGFCGVGYVWPLCMDAI